MDGKGKPLPHGRGIARPSLRRLGRRLASSSLFRSPPPLWGNPSIREGEGRFLGIDPSRFIEEEKAPGAGGRGGCLPAAALPRPHLPAVSQPLADEDETEQNVQQSSRHESPERRARRQGCPYGQTRVEKEHRHHHEKATPESWQGSVFQYEPLDLVAHIGLQRILGQDEKKAHREGHDGFQNRRFESEKHLIAEKERKGSHPRQEEGIGGDKKIRFLLSHEADEEFEDSYAQPYAEAYGLPEEKLCGYVGQKRDKARRQTLKQGKGIHPEKDIDLPAQAQWSLWILRLGLAYSEKAGRSNAAPGRRRSCP